MATVTCPKCGTDNSATAMNCTNCRINLQYALEHRDKMEFAWQHSGALSQKPVSEIHQTPGFGETQKESIVAYIGNVIFAMLFPIVVLWYGPKYLIKGEYIKGIVIILIVAAEFIFLSSLI